MKTIISLALVVCPSLSATTILFDLGRTDFQSGSGWNNIIPSTTELNSIIDQDGNVFGTTRLVITQPFYQVGESAAGGSEMPGGGASAYPVSATDDYLFGHTIPFGGSDPTPFAHLRLIDLEPTSLYTFTFFASRQDVSDTREARYSVIGMDFGFATLNASNNDSLVTRVQTITPDSNNEILVEVSPGPNNDNGTGFYYLGVMQVDVRPIPEPAAPTLLMLAVGILGRRRRVSCRS